MSDPLLVARDDDWTHHQICVEDEPVPLTVDVLTTTGRKAPGRRATRTVYLLPGGGLNTAAGFLTPHGRGLGDFLCASGFLVIGISPREDGLTSAGTDVSGWGLARHRRDVQRVVAAAQAVLPLPYDLLGHSAGAVLALDAAATTSSGPGPERIVLLDTTGPYHAQVEPELVARAEELLTVTQGLLEQGVQVVDPGLKALFARAAADPGGTSSVRRPVAGPASFFTNAGLLHYAHPHP